MFFEYDTILKEWGMTFGLVMVAAFSLFVLAVLSLREFLYWYLRLNQIQHRLSEIQNKIDRLEVKINSSSIATSAQGKAPLKTPSFPIVPKIGNSSEYNLTE